MSRRIAIALTIVLTVSGLCSAQHGGNIGYSQGGAKARAQQRERELRTLPQADHPPTQTSTFVSADVLMNVKADEYVAVFGIAQEGATVEECGRKMQAVVAEFTGALKELGVGPDDLFLDFIAQTKIYGFEVNGDIAREKLVGFELKKNLAVRYKENALLDKFVVAAARSKIYDLIKVDYVVRDVPAVRERLAEEAAKVIKRKVARDERLLGIKLQPPAQVFHESHGAHYPTDLYDAFTAAESEEITALPERQKYMVQGARKGRTAVFNGLDADGFDEVINPVVVEPVVQFTIHLKVKYEVEQAKAR